MTSSKSDHIAARLDVLDAYLKRELKAGLVSVLAAWPHTQPLTERLDEKYLSEMARRIKALGKALNDADVPALTKTWNPANPSGIYARALLLAARHPTVPLEFLERTLRDANRNRWLNNVLLAIAKYGKEVLGIDGLLESSVLSADERHVGERQSSATELTAVERAMLVFTRDPSQSVSEVARKVGCDRSLLYRDARFKSLRSSYNRTLPRGSKTKEGILEAEAY